MPSNDASSVAGACGPSVVVVGNDLNTLLTAYYLLWPQATSSNGVRIAGASSVTVLSSSRRLNFQWADQSVFSYWSSLMNKWRISSKLLSAHQLKATPSNAKFLYQVDAAAAFQQRYALMKQSLQQLIGLQQSGLFPFLTQALKDSSNNNCAAFHHIFCDKVHAIRELDEERDQYKKYTNNELVLVNETEMSATPELKTRSYQFSELGTTRNDIVLPNAFAEKILQQCQQKKFNVILNAKVKSLEYKRTEHNGVDSGYQVTALHSTQGKFPADAFVVHDSEAMIQLFGVPNRHLLLQRIVGMNVSKPNSAVRPVQFHEQSLFLIPDGQRMSVSLVRHYFTPAALRNSTTAPSSASSFPSFSFLFGNSSRVFVPTSDVRQADAYDAKHLIEGTHLLYDDYKPNTLSSADVAVRWEAVTDDLLPIVGALKPYNNVYLNSGHAFFGAASLPACAQWTARLLLQQNNMSSLSEDEKQLLKILEPERMKFSHTPLTFPKEDPVIIQTEH